ncbi:hypothetical protein [Vallitalea okinawensis]|uniref:hypothetical protein n=1 Tax=Vallitalea okinawensis TaxID=2078660 RepID=UPI000CFA8D08|nr:hypothetical protein [Vallitalea okinawensis]
MIKIGHVREVSQLLQLPQEVVEEVREATITLDQCYGFNRQVDIDLGGFVLIITKEEELYELKNNNIDVWTICPEFVDRITVTADNEKMGDWTNSLILANSDFSISLIMPLSITPQNFIDMMT